MVSVENHNQFGVTISILQMRRLKLRGMERLVQDHTAGKRLSWDSNPGLFGPSVSALNHPQGPGCLPCDLTGEEASGLKGAIFKHQEIGAQ